jgi:hypothetical protein
MIPRLALPLAMLALVAGCGGDEELRFSADEFVTEANARGAALELGAPLTTSREETEIHELVLAGEEGGEAPHGGGSLTVTADSHAGLREYRRCEAATTLLCFRANNVVVALEGELAEQEIATIELALARMAADSAE